MEQIERKPKGEVATVILDKVLELLDKRAK
jgi:hypothetical protein